MKIKLFKNLHRYAIHLLVLCVALLIFGFYLALFKSDPDYQQGDAVRMMYLHVPSAWMALGIYFCMGILSFLFLIWRIAIASILAQALSFVGLYFTFVCIVTGSIWGSFTWGAYWAWDARLTSTLVLFFLYLGYVVISNYGSFDLKIANSLAILNIFGCMNLPIIKFSVNLWNTLHQPASIVRAAGISVHYSMLRPLFCMFFMMVVFAIIIVIYRIDTILNYKSISRLENNILIN